MGLGSFVGALGGVRLFAGETALGNGRFAFGLGGANLDAKIIFSARLNSPGFMGFGRVNGKAVCKGGERINEV